MGAPASAALAPDTNYAPNYLIPCGILTVLALGLCVARIYSRLQRKSQRPRVGPEHRLSPDDYLIAAATVVCVVSYFVAIGTAAHGWGHLSHYVSSEDRATAFKCLLAQQGLGILAAALVRISVAWSLLRFSTWKPWKYSLWIMMGVQVLTYIGFMVLMLFNCRPLRSFWEKVDKPVCWDRKYSVTYGYVANVFLITMDFALAVMPIQLIRSLNRPLREKWLISCLMALGLLATGIAGYKMTLSKKVYTGDTLSTTVELSLWNRLEMLVGIVAACLPCLKSSAERLLHQIGILTNRLDIPKVSFDISLRQQTSDGASYQSNLVDSVHSGDKKKETPTVSSMQSSV